jgi:flagellar basal-body rod modification protein FlgD
MASAINALTGLTPATSTASSTPSSSSSGTSTPAPTEQMFLQLLVAQLQNQDPLNPTDSTTFVTQLAQFSELENVIGIRSDIEGYMAQSTPDPTSSTTTSTTSSTQPST